MNSLVQALFLVSILVLMGCEQEVDPAVEQDMDRLASIEAALGESTTNPIVLSVGVEKSGSVSANGKVFYSWAVVPGVTNTITLMPSSGDPDLYTSKYTSLGTGNAQCKSEKSGTQVEVCSFVAPTGSSYTNYALVYGYAASSYKIKVTTGAAPLATPWLTYPLNGATEVSKTTALLWNAVSGATNYRVQVATSPNSLGSGTTEGCYGSTCVINTTITSTSYSIPSWALMSGKKYYWQVRAGSSNSGSNWSATWNFTTKADLPTTYGHFKVYTGSQSGIGGLKPKYESTTVTFSQVGGSIIITKSSQKCEYVGEYLNSYKYCVNVDVPVGTYNITVSINKPFFYCTPGKTTKTVGSTYPLTVTLYATCN